jgi:serine/threonine protein kinase
MQGNTYFPIEIDGNIYRIDKDKILGRGSFGVVYRAIDSKNQEYAIKQFDFSSMSDYEKKKTKLEILNEINIMSPLKHRHIIKYFGFTEDKTNERMYILMELCDESLRSFLTKGKLPKIPDRESTVRRI